MRLLRSRLILVVVGLSLISVGGLVAHADGPQTASPASETSTPVPPTVTPTPLIVNISGAISSGTSGVSVQPGLAITLHLLRPSPTNVAITQDAARFQAILDKDHRYQFQNINAQSDDQFFISVFFEDVQQASNIYLLTPETRTIDVDFVVYGTTNDPRVVSLIRARHILSPEAGSLLPILSSYLFRNTSDRLYVSKDRTKANQPISVALPLPIGSIGVAFDDVGRFVVGGTAAAPIVQDTRPVLPGQVHEVVISYQVPYQRGAEIDQDYPFDTDTIEILIPNDTNILLTNASVVVTGQTLNTPRPVTLEQASNTTLNKQRPYTQYTLKTPLQATNRLLFTLEGAVPVTATPSPTARVQTPSGESGAPLTIILVIVAGVGLFLAAALIVRRATRKRA